MDTDKPKIYNQKWELTFNVRAPGPTVMCSGGPMQVFKVVLQDKDGRVRVICSGPLVHSGGHPIHRSVTFNVNGFEQHPQAPDWLLEMVRIAGFARVEV